MFRSLLGFNEAKDELENREEEFNNFSSMIDDCVQSKIPCAIIWLVSDIVVKISLFLTVLWYKKKIFIIQVTINNSDCKDFNEFRVEFKYLLIYFFTPQQTLKVLLDCNIFFFISFHRNPILIQSRWTFLLSTVFVRLELISTLIENFFSHRES